MKVCTQCGENKEDCEFHKAGGGRPGLRSKCKACVNFNNSIYNLNNAESRSEYRKANVVKFADRKRAYRDNNRNKILDQKRLFYINNRNKILEDQKLYVSKNKDKIAQYKKDWACKNREIISAKRKKYSEDNRDTLLSNKKIYSRALCTSKKRMSKLPITDNAEFFDGFVTVECKMCGKRFIPTNRQVSTRLNAFNGTSPGESNFYCSEICKSSCPIYHHRSDYTDPRLTDATNKRKSRNCTARISKRIKQLQCDEKGYNYCERCGDIIDVELHHTLPVAEFAEEAISSASHILLCAGCHTELHHSC